MKMQIGPDKQAQQAEKERTIDADYTDTQPLVYMIKITEALKVRDGGQSDFLDREASLRGILVSRLADSILNKADALKAQEFTRINRKLKARKDHG